MAGSCGERRRVQWPSGLSENDCQGPTLELWNDGFFVISVGSEVSEDDD